MKAAVYHKDEKALRLADVPMPEPKAGETLVKVTACGVCHTDLHYLDHGVKSYKPPPIILGHEASGVVADGPKKGARVLIPAVVTCGTCAMCRRGRENICESMRMFGNHVDGAFAEYVVAPTKDLIPVPDGIDLEDVSIVADAVSTPYHAVVNRGQVKPGDTVVVWGCGGVGMNAVQIAAALGARVFAVDRVREKLEIAKSLGAEGGILAEGDTAKAVRAATGGADVAFECIGHPEVIKSAAAAIRPGGRLVLVGFCGSPVELSAGRIMFTEQEVIGSLGCRPVDYPRILSMVKRGMLKLKPLITNRFGLDEINRAFDLLREGVGLRSIVKF